MANKKLDYKVFTKKQNQPGKWVYIVPVSGVKLSEAVNNEFRIQRVILVAREKLPRIRQRLGIPKQISITHERYKEFLSTADTFAVIRHSGIPQDTKSICRKIIQDELAILAFSQLGYQKRRFGPYPSIKGFPTSGHVTDLLTESHDARYFLEGRLVGKSDILHLNTMWKEYHRDVFFAKYLKVLNKEIEVSNSWRDELMRAAILIGQSQCSNDIAQSFLLNMIALELLLTKQGDKYTDVLPKRIEAFLGWVGYWRVNRYPEKIEDVYKKRSAFVHDGRKENITVKDLLFTDDLLLNLIMNLMRHIRLFKSKDDVIEFSKKVEAEHILGISSKVRPKTLHFLAPSYGDKDLQEI